jgi:hypothetical protein
LSHSNLNFGTRHRFQQADFGTAGLSVQDLPTRGDGLRRNEAVASIPVALAALGAGFQGLAVEGFGGFELPEDHGWVVA